MKKTENKRTFGSRVKHFFKHYFVSFLLALFCAVLMTLLIVYCA